MTKSSKISDKILNPRQRPYLSWSQLNLFERDRNLYAQVYWENVEIPRTKYLILGKRMADTLENGFDVEHDPMFERIATILPPYPKREHNIRETFDDIPLFGKLDGWDEETMTIGEYKTGKRWTQAMADNSGQLTFYALLVWLRYKTLPKAIYLHWAQTDEDTEGNLYLTGVTQTFKTERRLKDIIVFTTRIKKVWAGICTLGKFMHNDNLTNE